MKTIELVNTKDYPFNNSKKTVALEEDASSIDYFVKTSVVEAEGEIGDIIISDKAINGFKIEYSGSSSSAVIAYEISY